MNAKFIGLDVGTSALKGVLMDANGQILHAVKRTVTYQRPAPGFVEYDAEVHWRSVADILRELARSSTDPVRAVAISGASGNTLLTDPRGRPIRPAINWMDRRVDASSPPSALNGLTVDEVRRVTGWPCLNTFPLAHLAWLREHEPATWAAADHVGMNTDWLLFKLCGRWIMDYSTATPFHLQCQTARRWHRPMLERLGIQERQLSRLKPSGTGAGALTADAADATGLGRDTLAVTGAFDHPSAARAVGVLDPGQLMFSCGTSWVGLIPCADRAALIDAELLCDPFLSDRGGPWAGMFSVPAIGPTIDWYVDRLIAPNENPTDRYRIFDELAARAHPGAGGLTIDLLSPPQTVYAERDRIARAVMEGAARALTPRLQALRDRGFRFTRAVMVGGPGNSPVWPGILAEMTGLDLAVGSVHVGAQGAAILAGIGAGVFSDERHALAHCPSLWNPPLEQERTPC